MLTAIETRDRCRLIARYLGQDRGLNLTRIFCLVTPLELLVLTLPMPPAVRLPLVLLLNSFWQSDSVMNESWVHWSIRALAYNSKPVYTTTLTIAVWRSINWELAFKLPPSISMLVDFWFLWELFPGETLSAERSPECFDGKLEDLSRCISEWCIPLQCWHLLFDLKNLL